MKGPRFFYPLVPLFTFLALTLTQHQTAAQQFVATNTNAAAALEEEILREINLARTNPAKYAAYLEKLRPYFHGKEYRRPNKPSLLTEEGARALEEAISFLRALKPLPALTLSQGMCSGARELVKDQAGTDVTGHRARDGSFCEQRAERFGSWTEPIGENLSYGSDDARERVISLLIDDGVASRGHRKRILGTGFKVAGVACGDHSLGAMCVITLAGGFADGQKGARPAGNTSTKVTPAKRF